MGIWLMMATSLMAQVVPAYVPAEGDWDCEGFRKGIGAPYYYCDCRLNSYTFSFPLDTIVNDTVWYTASMNDLKKGMSAYWFSDCSVTMEVYAFCTNKEPIFQITVGPNQMRDVDAAFIQKKIDEAGSSVQEVIAGLTPHMRVYPNGGTGRVYCYPYDQGPESTCDDPLPLRPGMTYVCDKEENVYRMNSNLIPASGKSFIHWKQKKNQPCDIWLTLDSCTGEEIGRAVLSDSLHVYQPDSTQLVNARLAGRSLWLHVKHAKDKVGRVYFYTNPKYADALADVNQQTCTGKTIKVNEKTYSRDTAFTETLWVAKDTLRTMSVNLSFTAPQTEYDTLRLTNSEVVQGYRYTTTGTTIYAFGDYTLEAKKANTCTRIIQLAVIEKEVPVDPKEALEDVYGVRNGASKCIRNGQLIVVKRGRYYNVLGQKIKGL